MCTGTEMAWITAALTASSAAAKYAGDKKSQVAMDTMRQLERDRQQAHQKTANTLLGDTLETSSATTAEQDIAEAALKRQSSYQAAQTPSEPAQNYAASQLGVSAGNKVVGGGIESGQRQATNYGNTVSKALSRLGGYSDQGLARNIYNNRQLNQQANIGNFMQGSLGVLPIELQAANEKGDNMRTLGQILGAAGQVTGMMAAAGVNPFASAPAQAATTAGTELTKDLVVDSAGQAALRPDFSFLPKTAAPTSFGYSNAAGAFQMNPSFTLHPGYLPVNTAAAPAGWPTVPKFNLR